MARIEDIERRLLNWGRWRLGVGVGGLGYSSPNLADPDAGRDGYAEATVPMLSVEAEETDRGVKSLPSHLRATVEAVYTGGGSVKDKAARLCVSVPTVFARIDQAHYQLASWLSGIAQAQRTQRERVEALQKAARP